jgi:hypothetical protein
VPDTNDLELLRKQVIRYRTAYSAAEQERGDLERQVRQRILEIEDLKDELENERRKHGT